MIPAGTHPNTQNAFINRPRLIRLDVARGVALIAMAIYHFGWDLEFFGYLVQGSASQGWWRLFARCIATSFLFLVGFSLVLAHSRGVRWRPFIKRLAQIISAAAAISALTWFYFPQGFIFFGILHQIALASIVGLAFLRAPVWLILLSGILIIAAPHYFRADIFNHPALWWVGLSTITPVSNDYVPFFPWFGAVLIGMASAQIMGQTNTLHLLQGSIQPAWMQRTLTLIGRHSLIFYLVHQPVLIGLMYAFSAIVPPSPAIQAADFTNQCRLQCSIDNDAQLCQLYCDCMLDTIRANQLEKLLGNNSATDKGRAKLSRLSAQCVTNAQKGLLTH